MWIETLSNGKLRAVERYIDPVTEKQHKVSVMIEKDTAQQRKKAAAALQNKIKEKTNTQRNKTNITFYELLYSFMDYKKTAVKPSTYYELEKRSKYLKSIFNESILINKMTAIYVKNSIESIETTTKQKNIIVSFYKSCFRWGFQNDYVDDISFLDKITLFTEPKKAVIADDPEEVLDKKLYLESNELAILLSSFKKQYSLDITKFLALTGMRIGELIALEYTDIDLDKRYINVNKTFAINIKETQTPKSEDSNRQVYIQDELLPFIKQLLLESKQNFLRNGTPFLFTHKRKQIKYNTYLQSLKNHGKKFGWDIHPHVLRHTHVAILAEHGLSLDEISRRIGHHDSEMTKKVYFHVTEKLKAKENQKLNRVNFL